MREMISHEKSPKRISCGVASGTRNRSRRYRRLEKRCGCSALKIKKAQRIQHILRSCSLHYSQLSPGVPCWLASVVSLVCEIKSWDFHTKNEHDQESAIPAELPCLPVMTCHARVLPPWSCCMPDCAAVRRLALLDWRASLPESCSAQLLVPEC